MCRHRRLWGGQRLDVVDGRNRSSTARRASGAWPGQRSSSQSKTTHCAGQQPVQEGPQMLDTTRRRRSRRYAWCALASCLSILASARTPAATLRDGDIIVATGDGGQIVQVHPRTGSQTVISSGGLLGQPVAVAIEASGNIL